MSVSGTRSLDTCVGLLLSIIKSYGLHRSTSVWVGSWALDTGQKQTPPIIVCSPQSLHPLTTTREAGVREWKIYVTDDKSLDGEWNVEYLLNP